MSGFERPNNFWEELKKRNVVRALIFYAVTAWLIIQFAATTFPYLNLPAWSVTVVIVALLIGLPIVLIVSWIYELTSDGLKKTGSVDHEKSITVNTGKKLNRLTIAVLGLAVVFLLVDKFYLSTPAETSVARTESIAVFPFSVQGGEDIQFYREGMVDLISDKLDAIPGMNATDPNIILGANIKGIDSRNPISAAKAAVELGANRVIIGSLTEVGDQLQVKISKYDELGSPIGNTIIENGTEAELLLNVDNIVRRLVADELNEQGSEFESEAVLTTNKIESIVPYLYGLQMRRKGRYREASVAFRESISEDSTFAMAYWAYLESDGWARQLEPEVFRQHLSKLETLVSNLTGKNKEFILAGIAQDKADIAAIEKFQHLLDKYGESREVLNGLAESTFHFATLTGDNTSDAKPYFDRLIEIDPTNNEYLQHRLDIARTEGNAVDYEKLAAMFDGEADNGLLRDLQKMMLKDSVTDEELQEFISSSGRAEFFFVPARGPEALNNLKLLGRVMAISPELTERHKLDYEEGLMSMGGQHTDLINTYLNAPTTTRANNYIGSLIFLTGYPGNPNFEGFDKTIIDMMESLVTNPEIADLYINQYLLSLTYLNVRDYAKIDSTLSAFRKKYEVGEPDPLYGTKEEYKLMYYNLAGMRDFLQEKYEQSESYFDSAVYHVKGISLPFAEAFSLTRLIYRAETMIKLDKPAEALALYVNLISTFSNIEFIPLGTNWGFFMYRIAQLHDQLDHKDEAIAYYKSFAEAYVDADEKYQGWVSDSYSRLSILMDRPEAELRGEIIEPKN